MGHMKHVSRTRHIREMASARRRPRTLAQQQREAAALAILRPSCEVAKVGDLAEAEVPPKPVRWSALRSRGFTRVGRMTQQMVRARRRQRRRPNRRLRQRRLQRRWQRSAAHRAAERRANREAIEAARAGRTPPTTLGELSRRTRTSTP